MQGMFVKTNIIILKNNVQISNIQLMEERAMEIAPEM